MSRVLASCNNHKGLKDQETRLCINNFFVCGSTIDKRQRVWLGHTMRHGDLAPPVIEERVEGRRPPGRPRTVILDRIKNGNSYNISVVV